MFHVRLLLAHFLRSKVLRQFYFAVLYFCYVLYWNRQILAFEVTEEIWLPLLSKGALLVVGVSFGIHCLRLPFYRNNRRGSF
jgi:hypothetical protein